MLAVKLELEPEDDYFERILRLYLQELRTEFWDEMRALGNNQTELLYKIADICLNFMDLTSAELIYRQLGDIAMVMTVKELREEEDRNFIAGHISVLLADYNVAQVFCLNSAYSRVLK
jgi:hypothetical protein